MVAALESGAGEIAVPEPTRTSALGCIDRMLDFVADNPASVVPAYRGHVPHLGSA